jgi:hypothetical protein
MKKGVWWFWIIEAMESLTLQSLASLIQCFIVINTIWVHAKNLHITITTGFLKYVKSKMIKYSTLLQKLFHIPESSINWRYKSSLHHLKRFFVKALRQQRQVSEVINIYYFVNVICSRTKRVIISTLAKKLVNKECSY